jgi:hypothetical protein
MARSDDALAARARRGYELGRLAAGLRGTWPLALLLPLALVAHGGQRLAVTLLAAAGAFVAASLFGWRGGALARGASAGFLAGLPPLLLPMLVMARLAACADCDMVDGGSGASTSLGLAGAHWAECLIACGVGGLVAGIYVGLRAAREPRSPARHALAAASIAWLTGMLGCALVGATGALGIVCGLALGTAPVLLIVRGARAS